MRRVLARFVGLVCLLATGGLGLSAVARAQASPRNDNYLSSFIVTPVQTTGSHPTSFEDQEDTTAATTQPDLFNPDQQGQPFAGGGAEPTTCQGQHFGKTVWYDLHPQIPGGLELTAAGFPSAVVLYRWNTKTAQLMRSSARCQITQSAFNDFAIPFDLKPHLAYTIQVGGLQTSTAIASGALDLRVNFFPDHDADGIFDVLDACPFLRGVQRYGGCPPALRPTVHTTYGFVGASLRLTTFQVGTLPSGARVEAACRPCGLDQAVRVGRGGAVSMSRFLGITIPFGDKLEIWATKRASGRGDYRYGAIGAYYAYRVAAGGLPTRVTRCLMPGSRTPRTVCPPGGRRKVGGAVDRHMSPAFAWRLAATFSVGQ